MSHSSIIWRGLEPNVFLPEDSLGAIFHHFLKDGDPKDILLVDINAGEEITREKYLSSTITLAKYLKGIDISKGDLVGVISPNTWKYLIPVLSAFYLGATVSCSNQNYMKDDFQRFLDTAQPKVLFLSRDVYEKISTLLNGYPCVQKVILFDGDENSVELNMDTILASECVSDDSILVDSEDEDVALVLFSSGTTGLPKGVMLSHKALRDTVNLIIDPRGLNFCKGSVLINILPIFHVFGFLLVIIGFAFPIKLVLLQSLKPEILFKAIQDHKVTLLPTVPSVLQLLASIPLLDQYDLSSINDILSGSAAVGNEIEEMVRKRINNIYPRQIYGSTEVCGPIACSPPGEVKPGSVGKLMVGLEVKIIDCETKESLGPHKSGEVCVKGRRIMKGFLKDEEQTQRDIDEEGYLHTGDLGYFDEEDYLYIVGRIKEIIKYRGFQVAPVQLEGILLQHKAVRDVGVVGKPDDRAGELPTAFVVKQPNSTVSEEELVNFVKERVHVEKQLHGGVIFIEEIPRNTLHKIDRNKLQELLFVNAPLSK